MFLRERKKTLVQSEPLCTIDGPPHQACMWGRNVNDNIKKFLQFQVTVNIVGVALTFFGAAFSETNTAPLAGPRLAVGGPEALLMFSPVFVGTASYGCRHGLTVRTKIYTQIFPL